MPRVAALVLALCLCALRPAAGATTVTVFAAASLTEAMQAVGDAYADASGGTVRFSFAASSTLARQILAGAPAQVYCSASEDWMDELERHGLVEAGTRRSPFGNSLVLVAPKAVGMPPLTIDAGLDLAARLGRDGRLAVGDPAHVPAGIYARQALRALGLWDTLAPRLAPADNVRAALALVARGEAPYGIVYATDAALSDAVTVLGTFPADTHPPIAYPCAIVKGQGDSAVRAFFDFLTGPQALAIFARFGFRTDPRE